MCVKVDRSTRVTAPWDHEREIITIPAGLDTEHTVLAVRAVLLELVVQQPAAGAVCWCGEPVDIEGEVIGDAA